MVLPQSVFLAVLVDGVLVLQEHRCEACLYLKCLLYYYLVNIETDEKVWIASPVSLNWI
jgi:hypothetical protein